MKPKYECNEPFVGLEIEWLLTVLNTRLKLYFNQPSAYPSVESIPPPEPVSGYPWADFILKHQPEVGDRICLALSFLPLLKPQALDCLHIRNTDIDQRFTEFGCIHGKQHNGLIPTLETLIFLLAGDHLEERIRYLDHFSSRHLLFRQRYIQLNFTAQGEPVTASALEPSPMLIDRVLYGREHSPEFSLSFPARRITTEQNWDELVLNDECLVEVSEIKAWIEHGSRLLYDWNLRRKMKPGYRSLFYGPSGSGKTFTATLLGKYTGHDVYCIDLSLVVSKYIGETEKNLSKVFDMAENRDWILFFDEADALFGKRTNIKDAHDRYANQEVSFLLQRVEDFHGIVILSTNLKSNIDEAFARRFHSIIHFPVPDARQREALWHNAFSEKSVLEKGANMGEISEKYELTGGSIMNVVRYCSLMALTRNSHVIAREDIISGIRREYAKEGKTL